MSKQYINNSVRDARYPIAEFLMKCTTPNLRVQVWGSTLVSLKDQQKHLLFTLAGFLKTILFSAEPASIHINTYLDLLPVQGYIRGELTFHVIFDYSQTLSLLQQQPSLCHTLRNKSEIQSDVRQKPIWVSYPVPREDKGDREGIPPTHPIPQVIRLELFLTPQISRGVTQQPITQHECVPRG